MSESSFLSRWSRRKAAVREGASVPDEPPLAEAVTEPVQPEPLPAAVAQAPTTPTTPSEAPADLPTMADVALLRPGDNIARFVARGVDEGVKRAALKTLFADPHFNVMDGLDTYIDDYGKPDPIPPDVLRRLRQSEALGLFDDEETPEAPEAVDSAALPGPVAETAAALPQQEPDDAGVPAPPVEVIAPDPDKHA
ncbi:hypothetical protein LMG31506_00547 [Cupriavidus yeoncheonensis]|uniref:DUF3306 domain-containing protein n=1 Tax=Cupriavidus yeoncheonensis TaxID=1462994 RepID=A0A916IRB8_9BURK|nr:DUF3306 domain-containing protein [Cupriavidus yeoncheonensis]CAG2128882.1 hypothetical protein LMG31506_00547 [Cupriavidus yeoncheonensis]